MNWPNTISLFRISLAPLLLVALLVRMPMSDLIAAALFIFASATDGVDGYLARRLKQVTRFGKLIDPVADKLLIAAALLALVQLGRLPAWVALVIIGRELAITGLRSVAAAEGLVIPASAWGKAKTVFQIAGIAGIILAGSRLLHGFYWLTPLAWAVMWVAVVLTIYSGMEYVYRYWRSARAEGA